MSATAPATIRYQAKGWKPCFATIDMNQRITTIATRNETTNPIAIDPTCAPLNS